MNERIAQVKKALEANNMAVYYVDTKEQVVDQVRQLLRDGQSVAVGGSNTLATTGVLEHLRCGRYRFFDRYEPGMTPRQIRRVFLQSLTADTYLCSANAVTLNGELYNVDGNSNRIAAICYGPESVIMVVGENKIVDDLDQAMRRVKTTAAPPNARRQSLATPCAETGVCIGVDGCMTEGCRGASRMCCNYLISAKQRIPGRIKVILVGESVGF